MRYLKYLLMLFLISILFVKTKAGEVSRIDIDLKNDEVLINFIYNSDFNALYIQNNNTNTLIMFDYRTIDGVENYLKDNRLNNISKIYTITPVIIELFGIKGEYIKTENNLIILNYYNKNFCIYNEEYQSNPNLNLCKFLYVIKYKTGILNDLIGDIEVVFQNEKNTLPIKTQERIYDNWTELYTINKNEYTFLKISKEEFETLIIAK